MNFRCGICDKEFDVTDMLWMECCHCYMCSDCVDFHDHLMEACR